MLAQVLMQSQDQSKDNNPLPLPSPTPSIHASPSPSPSLVCKPTETLEEQVVKDIPTALDRMNIASTRCYKRKKVKCSGQVSLDSFKKTEPLSAKKVLEDCSSSEGYMCPMVEEKPEDAEARRNTEELLYFYHF